ncbi:sterile alpha motif domain-containing protein 15-like [Ischnura elegans]|uniref:sterile alpha motif domain-containing protein 15-like n=1 Tax=Ischnura elegans TaxID=197161 RepID=UPI001ED888AF|nr:sterile alpha motif domain-containing protein 15-like [Ischnura elegans]
MLKYDTETPFTQHPTKSKLPYYLDYRYCRKPQKRVPWLFTQNPLTLKELCGRVFNKLPPPNCWNWTIEEVGDWVEHVLGFPQYRNCFEQNYISGRKLILVDASTLPKWNITDFGHIMVITSAVRDMLNIEQECFARSVTLPPRDPNTMILIYKRPTGILIDRKQKTKILEEVRYLMKKPKLPENLWDWTISEEPKFPKEMVGAWRIRRNSPLFACKSSSMGEIIKEMKATKIL